jgi:hypothetical protein
VRHGACRWSKDSCPSYDDFSPGSTVRGVRVLDGVRWRK